MSLATSFRIQPSPRQLSVAAEAIAAAQFALFGFDVLEQAGQARFSYDLGVANSGGMMKVTVHGDLGGFWTLVEPYMEHTRPSLADRHRAIGLWLQNQSAHKVYCLVQFESADLTRMPRMYLASPQEIADRLHQAAERLTDSGFFEHGDATDPEWPRTREGMPASWRFSKSRIEELMDAPAGQRPLTFRFSSVPRCANCATADHPACLDCLPMMN